MPDSVVDGDLVGQALTVVRLGDLDHFGWWQSHGLDDAGSFILRRSFKRTWAATAMELSMASAKARHDETLRRPDAVHLFSDELPVFRLVESWLLEQKLEDDMTPFDRYRTATTDVLVGSLPDTPELERRGGGAFLGSISRSDLEDNDAVARAVELLLGGYRISDKEFVAPYVDLVS